jgi:hypothetical protein
MEFNEFLNTIFLIRETFGYLPVQIQLHGATYFFPIYKCFIFKDWIGQLNSNKIVSKVLVLPCVTAEKNNRTSFYLVNV